MYAGSHFTGHSGRRINFLRYFSNEDIEGVLTVFGLVPLATGLMGSSSLYTVFKLNTVEGKVCF